jgi:phosphoglycerate dehydrogenase-like enzyme
LVNISRGVVVDEEALVNALETGSLRAAGLDVFEHEPLPDSNPLWRTPNVLITPHAGGAMPNYGDKAVNYLVRNLDRFRSGLELISRVEVSKGY